MRLPRVLRRARPLVPDRAWPLLLAVRSATGDRPLIAEPDLRRVLVLAAHPDDESLGCAGTIAVLRDNGADVAVAFATDGEATIGAAASAAETARRRRAEAAGACAILGVTDISFWGLPDGGLGAHVESLGERIRDALATRDGVFLPWFLDGHADHQALGAGLDAAAPAEGVEVWGYETWTALPANRMVDVTAVWDRKERAIAAHVTAAQAFDLRAGLGINRWRSLHGLMGNGYAEGFLVAPAPEWLAMRRRTV
ncbi:MAG: PIG-L deacetylase family protein [Acidimicrobiales bacterium]